MRKRVVSLAFIFAMALGAVAGPAQVAVAAPAAQAVCVAETINVVLNRLGTEFFRTVVLEDAFNGGAGDTIAFRASNDECPPLNLP